MVKCVLVLNVYLPHEYNDNYNEFVYYLGKINYIVEEYTSLYAITIGEYNADIRIDGQGHVTHRFGSELINFCNEGFHVMDGRLLYSYDNFTLSVRLTTHLHG